MGVENGLKVDNPDKVSFTTQHDGLEDLPGATFKGSTFYWKKPILTEGFSSPHTFTPTFTIVVDGVETSSIQVSIKVTRLKHPPSIEAQSTGIKVDDLDKLLTILIKLSDPDPDTTLTVTVVSSRSRKDTNKYSIPENAPYLSADIVPTSANGDVTVDILWQPTQNDYDKTFKFEIKAIDDGSPPKAIREKFDINTGKNTQPTLNTGVDGTIPVSEGTPENGNNAENRRLDRQVDENSGDRSKIESWATVKIDLEATDPEGDDLIFEIVGAPREADFDPVDGVFTWTPGPNDGNGPEGYRLWSIRRAIPKKV